MRESLNDGKRKTKRTIIHNRLEGDGMKQTEMILTTADGIEGRECSPVGIVTAAHLQKWPNSGGDGERLAARLEMLADPDFSIPLGKLRAKAEAIGAGGIIGIHVSLTTGDGQYLLVTGTAVKLV